MKVSSFKSYDELPLFIKAETLSDVLGLSKSSAYELMREEGFPRCVSVRASLFRRKRSSNGSTNAWVRRNEPCKAPEQGSDQ